MKKLNQLVLHKAKIMTAPQMKHITGGYNGYDQWPVMCKMIFGADSYDKIIETGYCSMPDPVACEMGLRDTYTELWAPHGGFQCVCFTV